MSLMSVLGDLFLQFLEFFPRLKHIPKTHEAVRFRRGKALRVKCGLRFYWPITTSIMQEPVVRQTLNLENQDLTTKDEQTIALSLVVVYRVADILKALTEQWDLEDTITDIANLAAMEIVRTRTFRELLDEWPEARRGLLQQLRRDLEPYGVKVMKTGLDSFAKTRVLSIRGGQGVVADTGDDDE
jgi:regulator of protease activity HflC (stomatin/prohibitin superfamily)